jgi:hypothetical protein
VPIPTISWKQLRTKPTGGRFAGGTASSPLIVEFGSCVASSESILGTRTPPWTLPSK